MHLRSLELETGLCPFPDTSVFIPGQTNYCDEPLSCLGVQGNAMSRMQHGGRWPERTDRGSQCCCHKRARKERSTVEL